MAYKISDECIMCGTCEGECPVGAIAEGEGKYEIDADACIECGSCAAACPVGAISEYFIHCQRKDCPRGQSFLLTFYVFFSMAVGSQQPLFVHATFCGA